MEKPFFSSRHFCCCHFDCCWLLVVVDHRFGGRLECQTNNTSRLICTFHAKWKMHFEIHKTNTSCISVAPTEFLRIEDEMSGNKKGRQPESFRDEEWRGVRTANEKNYLHQFYVNPIPHSHRAGCYYSCKKCLFVTLSLTINVLDINLSAFVLVLVLYGSTCTK